MNTDEARLVNEIARFRYDPEGFVRFNYPWGKAGTVLENHKEPEPMQLAVHRAIRQGLKTGDYPIQIAVATGHGVGKSALVGQLSNWAMTWPDCRGVVTANTDNQLRTKTSVEIAKWHRLGMTYPWFKKESASLMSLDPKRKQTWRLDLIPWSKENTEAFAGLHNQGRIILLVFDEGSAIDDKIWEVAEGALTDKNTVIIWLVFGNPTRGSGKFFECFHRNKHRWYRMQVDSRQSNLTNKAKIQKWIDDYGEDSDFVRVRVRGVFPRAGDNQFISHDLAAAARVRAGHRLAGEPIVAGFDVALGGTNESVLAFRSGLDARIAPWKFWNEDNAERLAGMVAEALRELETLGKRVEVVFADGGGIGTPICQRLQSLGWNVVIVHNGSKSPLPLVYSNRAAHMWGTMKENLLAGLAIPDDETLHSQLTGREFYTDKMGAIIMEEKDDMKDRGLDSPDRADALALTFAEPVQASTFVKEYQRQISTTQRQYDRYASRRRA